MLHANEPYDERAYNDASSKSLFQLHYCHLSQWVLKFLRVQISLGGAGKRLGGAQVFGVVFLGGVRTPPHPSIRLCYKQIFA
jgi:hypothetical protein